jgi:ribose 5-phosphate isomerase RpiB
MLNGAEQALAPSVKRVGIAADHGRFALKTELSESLRAAGYEIEDCGAYQVDRAHFSGAPRYQRPLVKVHTLETGIPEP